jgi:hypothetical protein
MPREDLFRPNLKINLFFGDGEFFEDEYGNPIEKTKEQYIFARVSQSMNPIYYQMPGIQITDIFLKGNVVKETELGAWLPSSLPKNFNLEIPSAADLTLGDRNYKGRFKFLPIAQPIFPSLTVKFGELIFGYLNISVRA